MIVGCTYHKHGEYINQWNNIIKGLMMPSGSVSLSGKEVVGDGCVEVRLERGFERPASFDGNNLVELASNLGEKHRKP